MKFGQAIRFLGRNFCFQHRDSCPNAQMAGNSGLYRILKAGKYFGVCPTGGVLLTFKR